MGVTGSDVKGHGVWLYGVHRMRRDGSSFMWHHASMPVLYSVDIQKRDTDFDFFFFFFFKLVEADFQKNV